MPVQNRLESLFHRCRFYRAVTARQLLDLRRVTKNILSSQFPKRQDYRHRKGNADMRGFGVKPVVAIMVVLLLSGCSYSLSQIRENEPYQTLTSGKPPKELGKCIELTIRAETGGRWLGQPITSIVLEEYPNNVYRVALTFPGYTAVADILVKSTDSGTVVEYRRHHWWAGQTQVLEIIERCAQ